MFKPLQKQIIISSLNKLSTVLGNEHMKKSHRTDSHYLYLYLKIIDAFRKTFDSLEFYIHR